MQDFADDYAQTGAWIVSTYKTISVYNLNEPVFDQYEAIIQAGKTGLLLSPMRKLGTVSAADFEVFRIISGLKPAESVGIIKILEKIESINVTWDNNSNDAVPITNVALRNTEKRDILSIIGKVFLELSPTIQAKAVIKLQQETMKIPIPEDILLNLLIGEGYPENIVKRTIQHLVSFKILAETNDKESGSPLLYNPNVFQSDPNDIFAAINGLGNSGREEAMEILEFVRQNPGMPISNKFNKKLVDLLINCGLIDSSAIITSSGKVQQEFVSAPYVWGAIGSYDLSTDILDDAKLLLNCLRYGQLFSTKGRGKIQDPYILVNALIEKGSIGPASAIGQDYPMPLARGIVSIIESKLNPGRYYMELRKDDVAEAVKDVLHTKGILPTPIKDDEVTHRLQQHGKFVSIEQIRIKKELPPELQEERDSLAFSLRTHRRGR